MCRHRVVCGPAYPLAPGLVQRVISWRRWAASLEYSDRGHVLLAYRSLRSISPSSDGTVCIVGSNSETDVPILSLMHCA